MPSSSINGCRCVANLAKSLGEGSDNSSRRRSTSAAHAFANAGCAHSCRIATEIAVKPERWRAKGCGGLFASNKALTCIRFHMQLSVESGRFWQNEAKIFNPLKTRMRIAVRRLCLYAAIN